MDAMTALLGFTAWTLLLVVLVVLWRGVEILRGKPANSWGRSDSIAVPGFVTRASHAHLNCLENLPVFAVIVLAAVAMGKTAALGSLGCWVLGARIVQSLAHLIGTQQVLVLIRATAYFVQVGLFIYMLWSLLA
ncbi:MAPEG family protein [Solimonas marina]|uniref:MAPEG family protein n=1 Tax=Solimonas marina TaxID=2714601 RepID=A0A970B7U8_9GAMM|nr:MAPEG family protein [Solimonas marina]NKF24065.1 MAPEG family protein [Solimonas marina]